MKVDKYREQFSQQLKLGNILLQHRTRKDSDGDPLMTTWKPSKNPKKHPAFSWGWLPVNAKVNPSGVKTETEKAKDSEQSEIEKLKAELAAANAKLAEDRGGEFAKDIPTPDPVQANPLVATKSVQADPVEEKPKTDALAKARAAKAAKKAKNGKIKK